MMQEREKTKLTKRAVKGAIKRALSITLAASMLVSCLPAQALTAEKNEVHLPEISIGEDITDHDVFYLATASASILENARPTYLLRVGRGGDAAKESSALVKIADLTAKYGDDYVVRVHDEIKNKVNNPDDNYSLMEMIEGSDFDQAELGDEVELSEKLENDTDAQEAYQEGVESALDFLEDASGMKEKYGDNDPYKDAVEQMYSVSENDTEEEQDPASEDYDTIIPEKGEKETLSIGSEGEKSGQASRLQQAANLFTGQNVQAQRLTAQTDMFQDLQSVANVMTNVVVGASVELTFAPGENEKYLEIIPKDNKTGDGNRMFYLILGAPTGSTTNSAASTCAVTIVDDEEQEAAVVNFSEAVYQHVPGQEKVTITVQRSGAMNTVVSTKVKTTGEGTATVGRDYSQVDSELVFPFGVDHLTLDIPVRTEYLKGKGSFSLVLEPAAGCEVGSIAKADVTLQGTYSDKATLQKVQSEKQQKDNEPDETLEVQQEGTGGTTLTKNNLSTLKTAEAISFEDDMINRGANVNSRYESDWKGRFEYNESEKAFLMTWNCRKRASDNPFVYAQFYLTKDPDESFFYSGAEVDWARSNACKTNAEIATSIGGKVNINQDASWSEWGLPFHNSSNHYTGIYYNYWSDRDFAGTRAYGREIRRMYPAEEAVKNSVTFGGDRPQAIEFTNIPRCEVCTTLYLYSIKPILRPFQVNIRNADPLKYLQEDGTYALDTKAVDAEIVDGGRSAVYFKDDTFTVRAMSEVGVAQYGYLSGLELLSPTNESKSIYTLAENDNPANTSISYQLTKDGLTGILNSNGYSLGKKNTKIWTDFLHENPYALKDDGYPTYVLFNVKPTYSYVDSTITLRNPYDFPVSMTVSGVTYNLEAGESRRIKAPDNGSFHKGDTIAVSKIELGEAAGKLYNALGVRYSGKFQSTDVTPTEGTWDFVSGKPVYISGNGDHRLNFSEIVVEPNLQDKDNHIVVRVKTSDLSQFDTTSESAGFLKQKGTVEGNYTYFTYADVNRTANGRIYAITATPKSAGKVAVWYDRNTLRTYEGNTLYFTAGNTLARNTIDLSVGSARQNVTLQGTLNYTNYNLRTGFAGNTSQMPAGGATLAAGSAGGVADNDGQVTAGPVPSTGFSNRYLRYIVSVNGNDQVKEIMLPEATDTSVTDPAPLWDFNSDGSMSSNMGSRVKYNIDYKGEKDESGNDYYTFTAKSSTLSQPEVSIETIPQDLSATPWFKVRLRNLCGAKYIYLCATYYHAAKQRFPIKIGQGSEWQEIVVNLQSLTRPWDPNGFSFAFDNTYKTGSQIQIDYAGFFSNQAGAEDFRARVSVPAMLWDFNADNAMNKVMGSKKKARISYAGEKDQDGNDYYTFTANGADPYVSVDIPAKDLNSIQWVKIRARNIDLSDAMELYACTGSNTGVYGASAVQIPLLKDQEWHEYVICIPNENIRTANAYKGANLTSTIWTDQINWIRLDPMENNTAAGISKDARIQIDYIAFCPNRISAEKFRYGNSSGKISYDTAGNVTIDISGNFPSGVSPVTSDIFQNIQISGEMSDDAYRIDGGQIPIVMGKAADMNVAVKPADYSYTMLDKNGNLTEKQADEYPMSVQFVVYDKNDVYRGVYAPVKFEDAKFDRSTRSYVFNSVMDFTEPPQVMQLLDDDGNVVLDDNEQPVIVLEGDDGKPVLDENGKPIQAEASYGLIPEPGDKLYLRLSTDRMLQTSGLREKGEPQMEEYFYSDVYTGYSFYQPTAYQAPVPIGLDMPINITYGNLPFIGNTGMDLAFPFVSVGIMKISHGYRIYFGVSPVQIADAVKGTHMATMEGAGHSYWKSIFSVADPFNSFAKGISEASESIKNIREMNKELHKNNESTTAGDLGHPSWKFDLSIGMYFDFLYANVTHEGEQTTYFVFKGMGGYVSVTLGFQMAWYFILPVVFLPCYLSIEMQGTVMGYLGADFNTDVQIDYDSSLNGSKSIQDGITSLNGGIRGYGFVQISAGVGLCGTLGIRFAGKVNMIANWEPTDPHGDYGFFISLSAGGIIDLFLFSIPLMYTFPGWPFGTFEYYSNPESFDSTPDDPNPQTLALREGSGEDSVWKGNRMILRGAFKPSKDKVKVLAQDAYERPDAQVITLSDGKTLMLAFIDSDNSKGDTQRTTLKLSVYDADTGLWSTPVAVANDGTGDFMPSIAQMKDGRVLVSWVSPSGEPATELKTNEQIENYLNSMEVYAAFITLDENNQIKTKESEGKTVIDTEITQISNDKTEAAYDASPRVVCDEMTGDAMILYLKSDRILMQDGELTDYINPYTNDCVVCYMIYNAEADEDKMEGKPDRTVPAGWLFNDFYYDEFYSIEESEQYLINEYGGQRFLNSPTFLSTERDENGDRIMKRYAIPDFAAINDNGLVVYSYTVDKDGVSDTDADKELYLHVYDFEKHETRYLIQLTDNDVSDTMPQFFRSTVNQGTEDEMSHTRLYWYRDGKKVVYIDVDALLENGVNPNGTLKTMENGGKEGENYIYLEDGTTANMYAEPRVVFIKKEDSNSSMQSADFKAVEDDKGNLYVLWTETVTDEEGNAAQEIFGTGYVPHRTVSENGAEYSELSEWSKPYQITHEGFCNDEMNVAMSGENLITVHNRFREKLKEVEADARYNGQVDFMPIEITDMALVADVLEPCGSVETESIDINKVETISYQDEEGIEQQSTTYVPVTHPMGGDDVTIDVTVANNGMNTAQGYMLTLYAGDEQSVYTDEDKTILNTSDEYKIGEKVITEELVTNKDVVHTFVYQLPDDVDGLTFWAVAKEMKDAENTIYYSEEDVFVSDPIVAEPWYEVSEVTTCQKANDFFAKFTVTNTGNADSQEGDTLNIQLWGPANMSDMFAGEEGRLYSEQIALKAGETKEREVLVGITAEMMKEFGFVTARVDAERQVAQEVGDDTFYNTKYLSNLQYADFDLLTPMNMSLEEINVAVDERAKINFNMDLGDLFRNGDTVTYHVANPTVAAVENGVVIGVNKGTTTLYATHAATGAVVSANVNVTGERKVPDIEVLPTALEMIVGGTDSIDYTSPHEGRVTFASSNTGVAAVDANGSVKAIGVGKADITVMLKSDDGKTYTAVCSVTVTKEPSAEPPAPEKQEPSPAAKEDPKPSNTPATPAKVGDIITDASGSTSKGSDTSFVVTKAAMGSVPGEVTYKKEGKNSTTAAIVIPDTIKDAAGKEYKVTRIGEFAFAGNTKVKKVTVGKNVTAIDNGAFQNTTNLQSVILGESVETIGTQAFAGSKKLKTVKAKGSKIKTIKKGAFKACPVLKTVDLSASKVTKIEKQAFSGDKKLKTVKINANKLKSIGANAFAGATKKTKFIIFAKNKKIFNKWVKRLKKVGAKKSKFSFKKKK